MKLNQKQFKEKLKNIHGDKYECLDEYINKLNKIKVRCNLKPEHGIFETTSAELLYRKRGCPKCGWETRKNKKDINFLHNLAKSRNGKCLSEKYFKISTKYKWQCENGHVWYATAMNVFKQNQWCAICCGNSSHDINWLKNLGIKNKLKCLSEVYINNDTEYEWMCERGHKFKEKSRIIITNAKCQQCKNEDNFKSLKDLALKNNGKLISENYIGLEHNYEWQCERGHNWKAMPKSIRKTSWCPICKESKGEKEVAKVLKNNKIVYIKQYNFNNCVYKRKLKFDFYLPEYNLCIEYDGIQHFNVYENNIYTRKFQETQLKDQIKNKYCKDNNIKLIRIPYTEYKNIEQILTDEYNNGFNRSLNLSQILIDSSSDEIMLSKGETKWKIKNYFNP
jgi:very-short-patch-repair endonuclease/Zn ribbon nucleic-acid-binding protein